jgi:hypothetical protein
VYMALDLIAQQYVLLRIFPPKNQRALSNLNCNKCGNWYR